ncbi:MAG: alpha-L-fucosidase [Bacteroidota bacterium]
MIKGKSSVFLILFLSTLSLTLPAQQSSDKFEPYWESLRRISTPQWLRDGKFGIYTHWGLYSVHAYGENTTWYSHQLYMDEESEARKHFEDTFGSIKNTGYKDLIPKFTAEHFNADEWVALFKKAGAKFVGPVAEHHDGFAMWDTKYSDWNAAKMGPKKDIVGEFEAAARKHNLKFVTAFHHAANWWFFPVWDERYDTGNPEYAGLYGQPHKEGAMRTQEALEEWYNKIIEVIDNYGPEFIWFDFALDEIPEGVVKDFMAYYYNWALDNDKEVMITYKGHDLIPNSGVRDLELGQEPNLTYNEWITDNSVDDRGAWGYAENLTFKAPNRLIDNLVDRVSKNGYLLLNVGPKPDGTIPEGAEEVLLAMGRWLEVNGEAVYGTTPWLIPGEGPTNLDEAPSSIGFNESDQIYTSKDIRFTMKKDNLYATFLDWPGEVATLTSLRPNGIGQETPDPPLWASVEKIPELKGKILHNVLWPLEDDEDRVTIEFMDGQTFRVSNGNIIKDLEGEYEQEGEVVYFETEEEEFPGRFDGEHLLIGVFPRHKYPGFYVEEIKRISLLGDDEELEWALTSEGLKIKTPDQGELKHAFVFKIERHHVPPLKKDY